MLYKNSPIGELQERRHNEDQARSFNAVDTKATKIDILETKFFGNNTIPREENYPIIEEATTADPNTIRDEILPSDKVVLKPETNMEWSDYNITSPVRYDAKDDYLVCTWDGESMGVRELHSYHTKQAFVTIMGRILDTHSNVDKTDLNKSYVASSLGSTMTVKMEAIPVTLGQEIIVPCIPVYGKLRSDPYILDLARGNDFYDNVNTQPFPSITFPIITFTNLDPFSAEFYRFPHSSHLTGNEDDLHISKNYGICKVSSSSHPGVESQAAVHAGLIKTVNQNDAFIDKKRIIEEDGDTESTITDLEQDENIDVSRDLVYTPKIYSSVNSVRKNVAIVKDATGNMFNHDGLGMQCRVFKSLNCLAHTISPDANMIDVSIVYQTQLISTSNSKSETDEDEYFAEGESVYALIPVSMKIRQYNTDDNSFDRTVSVTPSSRGDLCWHDPDRSFISKKEKIAPSRHYEYNTQFDTIDKKITIYSDNNHEIRGYKLNLYSYNNDNEEEYMCSKIVFTYFNKITQQEFSPAYYNFPQFSDLDIDTTFIVTDIKVDDQGEEKLFVISYKINNQEYRTTLTCIPFESYYSIGSLIGATGLKKHMFINADSIKISDSIEISGQNHDLSVIPEYKNEEQSPSKIVTDNKYQVTLGGLNNFDDSNIYLSSAPYSYFKLAMYQLNKEDREVPTVWDKLSGSNNVRFTKSLTQENQPYAIPYRTKYSPAVFVWGNSFHAWKTNDFKVSHASGIFRQLMLPSYRTRGHAEYQDAVPLYTEAVALPMILPILQPMRNSDNHTVVKHGMYRYIDTEINGSDNTVKRLLLIRNPEKNNDTGQEYLNSMRGSFLGRCLNNQTDILYAYETPTDYAAFNVHLLNIDKLSFSTDDTYRSSYCNAYRKLSQSNVYQGKYTDFDLTSYPLPRSEFYQGFVGTIMVYPTKQLNQTGQYTNMDTVTQYNGMDFSHYNIIRGDKLVNVNNKSYLLHNEQFYPASLLYKYTSTSKQSVQINSLSGAGVIKLHTVGAYLFMVKKTHSEVYYQDENDIIPLFADSGTIIDSPVISGMDIFFCILSTDKTQIKVYSINRLDIVKRGIIYSSSEVKNSIVFWSSKVKYPSILYTEMVGNNAIKITFKSIFPAGVVSMGDLPTISGQNIRDLLIRTKTINGAVGEPEFLISVGNNLIIASLDTRENEEQSMKIKSSVITLPEYQENMFILTGIEVSVIQYKSVPLRTLKIDIYNAFNSESIKEELFTGNNIDVVHGKVLLSVSPDMDIRRIYYTIESEGYKITGVNLVGYFTELI